MKSEDFYIDMVGKPRFSSPIRLSHKRGDQIYDYVTDDDRILFDTSIKTVKQWNKNNVTPITFEKAGPRENLFFNPSETTAAIVTCGGLCPGLNSVIRSIVHQLYYRYGVKRILGIQFGYEGLNPAYKHPLIDLTIDFVQNIHLFGGTVLGSSRGNQDVKVMVDTLANNHIDILFAIGGDGTLHGAHAIYEEIKQRNLPIVVATIPKTIDNDINYIEKSFGFETASSISNDILRNAHNEAIGVYNGIALVKLMGRDSGFIAASATLSLQDVNFVLVPEVRFELDGHNGFLMALKERIERRHHALIVVAEGAGQDLFQDKEIIKDKSGNILHKDIGIFLKEKISAYFDSLQLPYSIKYIDPSYIIRSAPANASDSMFCNILAQNAVHAAMAGKTDFVVGYWNNVFTLLPISVAIEQRKKIDPEGELWWHVLETTGQPRVLTNQ
jgi:6-phosphofructokinase 1